MKLEYKYTTEHGQDIVLTAGEMPDSEETNSGVVLSIGPDNSDSTSVFLSLEDFEDLVKIMNSLGKSIDELKDVIAV